MNPKGGGFLTVAGTSTPTGASPSRSVWHRQDRVGRIVECDQPKGEQKGAYSLLPHPYLLFHDGIEYRFSGKSSAMLVIKPRLSLSYPGTNFVVSHYHGGQQDGTGQQGQDQ